MNQLVAINLDCERKNQYFNITNLSEEQIQAIEERFKNKKLWVMHRRFVGKKQ